MSLHGQTPIKQPPLLGGHYESPDEFLSIPILNAYYPFSWGWLFNGGWTVLVLQVHRHFDRRIQLTWLHPLNSDHAMIHLEGYWQ